MRGEKENDVHSSDYNELKSLDWRTAVHWLVQDARDDFFPDPLHYVDLRSRSAEFLQASPHDLLKFDRHGIEHLHVPKTDLLSRDGVLLPIAFRLPLQAILVDLAGPIAARLSKACFSFRLPKSWKTDNGNYPFPTQSRLDNWEAFGRSFREDALEGQRWSAVTDLANYFEHVRPEKLASSLLTMLPTAEQRRCAPRIGLLERMLKWSMSGGHGVPQNYDPTQFFCNALMCEVDTIMSKQKGVRYFRFVDDIRIVARTRGQVVDAVSLLQDCCRRLGLFLNSKKTRLISPGQRRHDEEFDVSHDRALSEIERLLQRGDHDSVREALRLANEGFVASTIRRDGRRIRAYGGRMFNIGKFAPFKAAALDPLQSVSLRCLRDHHEMADQWTRFLSARLTGEVVDELVRILKDPNHNRSVWVRQHILATIGRSPTSKGVMDVLWKYTRPEAPLPTRSWAFVAIGRLGDNRDRKRMLDEHMNAATPSALRRSIVVATQELAPRVRDQLWGQAAGFDAEVQVLGDYLRSKAKPEYDQFRYGQMHLAAKPRLARAIGTSRGFQNGVEGSEFETFSHRHSGYDDPSDSDE